jgi:hypothetical protein
VALWVTGFSLYQPLSFLSQDVGIRQSFGEADSAIRLEGDFFVFFGGTGV